MSSWLRAAKGKLRLGAALQHPWVSRQLTARVPYYSYSEAEVLGRDGASSDVVARRRDGLNALRTTLGVSRRSQRLTAELEEGLSEMGFRQAYRVPFPYRDFVQRNLAVPAVVVESGGARLRDLDDGWGYDLGGSFGLNVFGYEFYKQCVDRGVARGRDLGPVLGALHPMVAENVSRLKAISGLGEVSFHMSGTEAVMQAVRLARFHTGRSHLVLFSAAYHGWWDGVQPGATGRERARDVHTLRDMHEATLARLRAAKNIACVLVNPLHALSASCGGPNENMLISSSRSSRVDRAAYAAWLRSLRAVCDEKGIVLIFDEVFLGFRLAYGGAQEYFGVRADMVTYGKTVGGGLPIGVLCGRPDLMRRYRDDRPLRTCFARGTFSAHPYVMGAMNEFLRHIEQPEVRASYVALDRAWNERAVDVNARFERAALPIRAANLGSVWTLVFTAPSWYNWMLQFYLRAEGLWLGTGGTATIIFPHDLAEVEFEEIATRLVRAAQRMDQDGWWHQSAAVTNHTIQAAVHRELVSKIVDECLAKARALRTRRGALAGPSGARARFPRAPLPQLGAEPDQPVVELELKK